MNKLQYSVLISALLLFLGLYLGFDTKPSQQKKVETSRALQGERISVEALLSDGKAHLDPTQAADVTNLEQQASNAATEGERVAILKQMSGLWYRTGNLSLSGVFAEEAAVIENTDTSWSVAGATFFNALSAAESNDLREFTAKRAVKAFESAASLQPDKVEHRVNLALVYAENPPPDNPMKAVLMLRDLESQYPESPAVYNALGRLAIKTGQWERAIERLEKARSLDAANPFTPCLLSKAYEGAGQADKAQELARLCKQ